MAELKGSNTEKNLQAAFAGESQAFQKYNFYAAAARKAVMGGAAAHRKCRKWIATAGWFAAAKYLLYGSQGTAWQTGSSGQRGPTIHR